MARSLCSAGSQIAATKTNRAHTVGVAALSGTVVFCAVIRFVFSDVTYFCNKESTEIINLYRTSSKCVQKYKRNWYSESLAYHSNQGIWKKINICHNLDFKKRRNPDSHISNFSRLQNIYKKKEYILELPSLWALYMSKHALISSDGPLILAQRRCLAALSAKKNNP